MHGSKFAKRTPIALFGYNRPASMEHTLNQLNRCDRFKDMDLIIYVDGPRNDADAQLVNETAELIRRRKQINARLIIRKQNFGLKKSIHTGVSEVVREYGRAIVLEDDFLFSKDILSYFEDALEKYSDHHNVKSISAYLPHVPQLSDHNTALCLPTSHPWGWATWERAWSGFDINHQPDTKDLKSRSFRTYFNCFGLQNYCALLKLDKEKQIDSWFINWNYSILMSGGYSVFPPRSLVRNHGLTHGTHTTGASHQLYKRLNSPEPSDFDFDLPDQVRLDFWAIDHMKNSMEARVFRIIHRMGRFRRMLRK